MRNQFLFGIKRLGQNMDKANSDKRQGKKQFNLRRNIIYLILIFKTSEYQEDIDNSNTT